jgi:Amt family ammonium transporter
MVTSTGRRGRGCSQRRPPTTHGLADFFFQVVFVATAMSIVSGAVAERMKLWAFLLFAVVMTGFIYPVQGYWKWGGGWLACLGFNDFAGSGIVHLCGASAALAGVLLLGARKGKYGRRLDQRHPRRQPAAGHARHLHPLAGLVRLQRRLQLALTANIESANAVAGVFVNTNMAAAGGLVLR